RRPRVPRMGDRIGDRGDSSQLFPGEPRGPGSACGPGLASGIESLPVGPDAGPVLIQEVETAEREATLEQDAIVVVSLAVDAGVLGQVGQDAAVPDAGLDLDLERALAQRLADGLFQAVEPLPLQGADGDRVVVVGL